MKIAIIADIHANLLALGSSLIEIHNENIDTIFIAGDFLGYYFDSQEIFDVLESFVIYACQGNHDAMFLSWNKDKTTIDGKKYNYHLYEQKLSEKTLLFLQKLKPVNKVFLDNLNFLICHGSPWNRDQYVYNDTNLEDVGNYEELDVDVIIQGHTHYQMVKKINNKIIINPGSVGQPRSKNSNNTKIISFNESRSEWVIFDTKTNAIQLKTTYYENSSLIKRCVDEYPGNPYLREVLVR